MGDDQGAQPLTRAARHRWQESFRDEHRTVRACEHCGLLKISRHEFAGGREQHWTEFYRGTERAQGNGTPACEVVAVAA